MCGITGFINYNHKIDNNARNVLYKMRDSLERRGPDDKGEFFSDFAALGHRRLSVVDIEHGHQPMIKEAMGNTYVLCYNGELYNTDELRTELLKSGYEFTGHSDTEVLLSSYIEWGSECVKKLNGIFAFAIFDENNNRLFFARDGGGVKPFFYCAKETGSERNCEFIFGSEIKALLNHPSVSTDVNRSGIAEIFLIGPGKTPGITPFKDIKELKPGWCGTFDRENGLKLWQYWSLKAHEHTDNMSDTIYTVKSLICDAIKRQLVSDVPLCTFLSGGLDSSIISAVAAEEFKKTGRGTLDTFSVDYEDNEKYFQKTFYQPNSDDHYINLMSESIGSRHHTVVLDNNTVGDALYDSVLARDLPGLVDIESSLLLFCHEVKKTHTVVLSGECADEIFGGYPWYTNKEMLAQADFPWSGNTDIKASLIRDEYLDFDPEEYVYTRYIETVNSAPKTGTETPEDARIKEISMLNFSWFMQTLLSRKDFSSMYNGLEVRVPFCDLRIWEYAYNIPWVMKGYAGREKGLLRKAFSDILPHEIVYRKKSPYPKSHNPIYTKNVEDKVKEILKKPNSPILEIVKKDKLSELLETKAGMFSKPWYGQLMNYPQILAYMYMIDTWLKAYNVNIVD
ncbi:MAG: asparagine synthase (glutamine-hydrolyzing) [Clostridiales bacterium]|nr:asparagine synthase (glutamine-hydrolyzing) [Clostridiales bacterium]